MATSRRCTLFPSSFFVMLLISSISVSLCMGTDDADLIWGVSKDDAIQSLTWNVTYGTRSPLGVFQQVSYLSLLDCLWLTSAIDFAQVSFMCLPMLVVLLSPGTAHQRAIPGAGDRHCNQCELADQCDQQH